MTTKLEYLKKVIQNYDNEETMLGNKQWYTYCFAIPLLNDTTPSGVYLEAFTKKDGIYYLDRVDGVLVETKISDYTQKSPLFVFQDYVDVDESWLPSIKGKQSVKIGNLILNSFIMYPTFGKLVPYIAEKIDVKTINKHLIHFTVDDDLVDDSHISTDKFVQCYDRLNYLTVLGTIVSMGASYKTVTKAPGTDELKKTLIKKFNGDLSGTNGAEFESELKKLDEEYLKGDEVAEKVFNKNSYNNRMKMMASYGAASDFDENTQFIPKPLSEGLDTDPDNFPYYMNDLRYASYSRGGSTAKSGYVYKVLQRSLSSIVVVNQPCNTKNGLVKLITDKEHGKLVGREVKDGGKWVLVKTTDMAKNYINKTMEVRSPMYCTSPGNTLCYSCLSVSYKDNESAISNAAANISSAFMTLFLKRMHASAISSIQMDVGHFTT